MSQTFLVVGGVVLGIAAASLWRDDVVPPSRGLEAPKDEARSRALESRLEQQIEELRVRLTRLERLGSDTAAREAVIAPAHPQVDSATNAGALLAAIDDAMRQRDREKYASLDDAGLLRRARWLLDEQGNREDAQRALEALLARPISAAIRAAASHALGEALHRRGDFVASVQAWQKAVDLFGLGARNPSGI